MSRTGTCRAFVPTFVTIILIVSAAQPASVLAAGPQPWIKLSSPNFIVVTNGNDKQAHRVAYRFEMIRAVFRDFFPTRASGKDRPVTIVAAKDENTFKTLLPQYWAQKGSLHPTGFYLGGVDKSYIVLRLDVSLNESAYEPYEVVNHEYVHYLTRRTMSQLPLWIVEGLAEFYGNTRVEGKTVFVGAPSTSRLMVLRQNPLLPLNTLFGIDASSPYYHEENKASIFYAESWALTHYLIIRDWREKTQRLNDFLDLLGNNVPALEAAKRSIGDQAALEAALEQYIHNFSFTAARINTPNIDETGFVTKPISEAESLAVRADFLARDRQYALAQEMLERSLELDPKSATACEAMGFLKAQQDKAAEAEKWYSQALALNSESYLAHFYYAVSLLKARSGGDWATLAESHLRAALTINSDFAPAHDALAYVLAFALPKQNPEEGYIEAGRAIQLEPGNVHYRVQAVHILERLGRADDAIKAADLAVARAQTPQERTEASAALTSAQQYVAYKNRVGELSKAQSPEISAQPVQNTPQAPEQKVQPNSSEQKRSQNVAEGGDHGLGHSQRGSQMVGPAEVLSDTMGVDFGPYVKSILPVVKQNWYRLIPDSARPPMMKKGKLAIEVAILKDGKVPAMQLVATSGDVALDRAAWAGITNSQPFPPLPPEFMGDHLSLRFYFYYNPGKSDLQEPPTPPTALSLAIESIKKIERKTERTKDDLAQLEQDTATLTKALDGQKLDSRDTALAHYYRGMARSIVNAIHRHEGEQIDLPLAQAALADFEFLIANPDTLNPLLSVANAQYMAGRVASNQLHSEPLAYSYWDKCAQQGHAGCLNIMASARLTGKGGQKVDFREALQLHTKVFKTGTEYRCAGAYSARAIAAMIYFTGVHSDDDELAWLDKAYPLLDAVETKEKNKDACDRSGVEIEEYLYRLSRGERRDTLLQDASGRLDNDSPVSTATIQLLLGGIDKSKFEAAVESSNSERARCIGYFNAMWYMELAKNHAAAEQYHKHLLDIGEFYCSEPLVYAKSKFEF